MTDFEDLLTVGHIRKAHGLAGEVVVRLSTNRMERVAKGAALHAVDRTLVVRKSRPKDADFLVSFDGVSTREAADELRGTELRAEPLDDPDELWVHELIDSIVVDASGIERGRVIEVQANPASDLLVLDTEALVPATFIVDVDLEANPRRVDVDVPDGLFDL